MKLITWKGIPNLLGWRVEGWRERKVKVEGGGEEVERRRRKRDDIK